jgi:uncharacterized membrane protein
VLLLAGFEQLPTAVQPCQSCEVEQTIQITAPHTRVYNLLLNVANMPHWDPAIREVTHIRRTKYLVRTTTLGTLTLGLIGAIPYDRISWQIDGSFMQGVTFRVGLADKLAQVDVTAKVSPATAASQVEEIIGLQLAALKQYAEYLANGGIPEAYKKSTDLIQGVGWIAT